jgi:hypothetical protein
VRPTQSIARQKIYKKQKPLVFGLSHKNLLLKISYTLKEVYAIKINPGNAKTIFLIFDLPNHRGFV